MHCREFEARFHELLDQRASAQADLLLCKHASVCPRCEQMLLAQDTLWDGLELSDLQETSPGFTEAVMLRLESLPDSQLDEYADSPHKAPRDLRVSAGFWSAFLALAASGMFVLFSFSQSDDLDSAPGDHLSQQAESGVSQTVPPLKIAAAVDNVPDFSAQLSSNEISPLLLDLKGRIDSARADHQDSIEQMTSGLRPITVSFTTAFSTLQRTLPSGHDQGRSANSRQKSENSEPLNKPQAFWHFLPSDSRTA